MSMPSGDSIFGIICNGLVKPDMTTAPTKVRGTGPGKVKWSYCDLKKAAAFRVGIP